MSSVARDLLWPSDSDLLVRVVFLHVGQGSSTIVLAANGATYETMLLDIHLDENLGGIDVPRLMADLLDGGDLDVFVNSHPHNDHTRGIEKLLDAVDVASIWHSGHIPSNVHESAYAELQRAIKRVTDAGGDIEELCGSRTARPLGEAECYVLAPAQHVKDDIGDETTERRDRRIHEHCAVLRVGSGDTWVMLPGDADRDAWEKHIAGYYGRLDKLASVVLAAPHHGSRSFFRYNESDDPYMDALESIDPEYVVISAPKHDESPHEHPHDDAVEFYTDAVEADNVLHTGANRYSFICDLFRDGLYTIVSDEGALVDEYGLKGDGDEGSGAKKSWGSISIIPSPRTRIDDRPMG